MIQMMFKSEKTGHVAIRIRTLVIQRFGIGAYTGEDVSVNVLTERLIL